MEEELAVNMLLCAVMVKLFPREKTQKTQKSFTSVLAAGLKREPSREEGFSKGFFGGGSGSELWFNYSDQPFTA